MSRGKKRRLKRGYKHRVTKKFPDLAEVAAQLPHCWICAGPAEVVGIFFPDDPDLWAGPPVAPGKRRALAYGLCNQCMEIPEPERNARIEALLKEGAPC